MAFPGLAWRRLLAGAVLALLAGTASSARAGTIERSKVGKRVLVKRASVEAHIAAQRAGRDEDENLFA